MAERTAATKRQALYEKIVRHCAEKGLRRVDFARRAKVGTSFLTELKTSGLTDAQQARVEAVLAGCGIETGAGTLDTITGQRLIAMREAQGYRVHEQRRPGETLHDCLRRIG